MHKQPKESKFQLEEFENILGEIESWFLEERQNLTIVKLYGKESDFHSKKSTISGGGYNYFTCWKTTR